MAEQPNLFPEIGKVADDTSQQPESEVVEETNDDDRAVQEIDSLCMRCYKQVRTAHAPTL